MSLVIGHRGASAYRPENTLPAYELAVAQGADCLEIDLHTTRDGVIVITHDATLDHLGGQGEVADVSLAEIRALDAGSFEGAPTRVPTLDEVLDAFGDRIPFNLEIKSGERRLYDGIEAQALAALRERGLIARTLFSSFWPKVLENLKACDAEARVAILVSPRRHRGTVNLASAFEIAPALGAEAINPHFVLADEAMVGRAHDAGLSVYCYTVDDEGLMKTLLDRGVDGLFTNKPDVMRRLVDAR